MAAKRKKRSEKTIPAANPVPESFPVPPIYTAGIFPMTPPVFPTLDPLGNSQEPHSEDPEAPYAP